MTSTGIARTLSTFVIDMDLDRLSALLIKVVKSMMAKVANGTGNRGNGGPSPLAGRILEHSHADWK